jgi:hypothetical protein
MVEKNKEVFAHQGFATGKHENAPPVGVGDLIDKSAGFGCRELVRRSAVPFAATVYAAQIAVSGCLPKNESRSRDDVGPESGQRALVLGMGHLSTSKFSSEKWWGWGWRSSKGWGASGRKKGVYGGKMACA